MGYKCMTRSFTPEQRIEHPSLPAVSLAERINLFRWDYVFVIRRVIGEDTTEKKGTGAIEHIIRVDDSSWI